MERSRILLRRAKELGAAVHFDMEQYAYKDITLSILKRLLMEEEFRDRSDIGVTIQGYLRDSKEDLQGLIDWAKQRGTPITIRLVKGAYWDQETIKAVQKDWQQPVFNDKAETDANYEAAIGSHNVRSQAHAIAIAKELNIPKRRIEFQTLYGMGDKLAKAIVEQGYRVRVYCPYGELIPGMSYLIRRLLENTANSSFLRQNLEERSVEELIAPPAIAQLSETNRRTVEFVNAADTDYAELQARDRIQAALKSVRQQLGKTYLPYINGEFVKTQETIESVNPSRFSEVVGTIGMVNVEQAERAIATAKAAFKTWKRTSVSDRAQILRKAADLMEERRDQLIAWMTLETGKPVKEGDGEVSEAIDFCRYYADEMERLDQGVDYNYPGETNRYHYQPRGLVVVISPWNFPFAIPTGMVVAGLVTGNCVLLKPAETSSVIAAKLAEILIEAGIPKGVFQFVPGDGPTVGAHLVQHKDVHMIVFTGSQAVGCQIYATAATLQPGQHHLKRVVAEMGGKNAVIVDESADLDQAVQGVVQSAFGFSGQKCSACSRAIVLEPIYETFLARLVEATRSLNIGEAEDPSTRVGPVIDAESRDRIQKCIEWGEMAGTVVLKMPVPEGGYFVGPTIITDVSPDTKIAQEEIFGPVLAIMKAKTFQEALDLANGTPFALTGGLYSRTPSHIEQAQAEYEVGNLYINRGITGAIVARQPFGGFKLSGVGSKAGGPDYLQQFLEPRVITENVQRQGFAPIEGAD
jgi:RHH-type transcriptional regulator, proline utilization regulon repressor / proline dehydrogenase / delta 1-pyrroline-5-carboxylate dehydrogenase